MRPQSAPNRQRAGSPLKLNARIKYKSLVKDDMARMMRNSEGSSPVSVRTPVTAPSYERKHSNVQLESTLTERMQSFTDSQVTKVFLETKDEGLDSANASVEEFIRLMNYENFDLSYDEKMSRARAARAFMMNNIQIQWESLQFSIRLLSTPESRRLRKLFAKQCNERFVICKIGVQFILEKFDFPPQILLQKSLLDHLYTAIDTNRATELSFVEMASFLSLYNLPKTHDKRIEFCFHFLAKDKRDYIRRDESKAVLSLLMHQAVLCYRTAEPNGKFLNDKEQSTIVDTIFFSGGNAISFADFAARAKDKPIMTSFLEALRNPISFLGDIGKEILSLQEQKRE